MTDFDASVFQMIRLCGLRGLRGEEVLITLQIVSDVTYAWEIVDTAFTQEMQLGLKKDPSLVGKLRATFLKVWRADFLESGNLCVNCFCFYINNYAQC